MTQIQTESIKITDLATARALRHNNDFLAHFIVPLSPSDVAPRLSRAANLAHHHARKLADVGLLFEQQRKGGEVLYQLAAREFRVPSELLPPEDEAGNSSANMRQLSAAFLRAYQRSWRNMQEGEEDVYGFGNTEQPAHLDQLPYPASDETYPTYSDTLTLRLTSQQFEKLARALSAVLDEAQAGGMQEEGTACTLAVLAFQTEPSEPKQLSRNQDSFWAGPRHQPNDPARLRG